jgi:hypothetical protein
MNFTPFEGAKLGDLKTVAEKNFSVFLTIVAGARMGIFNTICKGEL